MTSMTDQERLAAQRKKAMTTGLALGVIAVGLFLYTIYRFVAR
jgi:hypothetical protein